MAQIETTYRSIPVATGSSGARFSSFRGTPKTEFLSQLIAEREHLAAQRQRRQTPLSEVLRTYDAGGKMAVRRLPAGYRLNLEV